MKIIESLNNKNYIGGRWVEAADTIPVLRPESGEVIGYTSDVDSSRLQEAIDSTVANFQLARQVDLDQRVTILRKWHSLIINAKEEIAKIIAIEQGKVISDALKEVLYGASFVEWFAGVIYNLEDSSRKDKNQQIITHYEPIGPVAAITPWNFPCAMITRKITPALVSGCSVLLKPSELTPFTALFLTKLLEDAGLPGGILNVITGKPEVIGKAICDDFRVRKISFTGSTRVGKLLYQDCAESVKRLSLELGGNAPYIVLADSDIEKAVSDLITCKIRGNGQSCTSANRIFIESGIYDQFIKQLVERFKIIKVTNCLDPESQLGPLINVAAVNKISSLIDDAKQKGARLLCGGEAKGNLFTPTVLADCTDDMNIFKAEIFGPVAACYKFNNIEEVIKRANNTEYGLQAYVNTNDKTKADRLCSELDFGMVSVNNPLPSNAKAPFSGRKASGFGVEGSLEGLYEYLNTKYLNIYT
jgi:succinate-semialdehyde dehydrogenase/glutarate-semialdehyde dehydrogenase